MCEGRRGDVGHVLLGDAGVSHGDMSEASFEERRGQLPPRRRQRRRREWEVVVLSTP